MSDSQFAEDSIEAMLVAIADGVREAQQALAEAPPVDPFGRPLPRYQLPYVDFSVQVMMESVTTSGGRGFLRFAKPSTQASNELTSTISGRLAAVPPGEGLPVPRLIANTKQDSARKFTLAFAAANSAGEVLADQDIEINFHQEASIELSKSAGVALTGPGSSRLADAIVTTGADGLAMTTVTVDGRLPNGAVLVYRAELGGAAANVSIRV